MRHRFASLAVLVSGVACGRVGFQAPEARLDATVADGAMSDDGAANRDSAAALDGTVTDTLPGACATAMELPLATRVPVTTCDTGLDLLDGCGPAGAQEVIFKFVVPAAGGYNIRAYDPGSQNVSNSIGLIDAACATVGVCAGIYGTSLSAGDAVYFAIEADAGGCVAIELEILSG